MVQDPVLTGRRPMKNRKMHVFTPGGCHCTSHGGCHCTSHGRVHCTSHGRVHCTSPMGGCTVHPPWRVPLYHHGGCHCTTMEGAPVPPWRVHLYHPGGGFLAKIVVFWPNTWSPEGVQGARCRIQGAVRGACLLVGCLPWVQCTRARRHGHRCT